MIQNTCRVTLGGGMRPTGSYEVGDRQKTLAFGATSILAETVVSTL